MNKRIYCVLLSVLIPFSIHPTRHNYDIPEEWDTVLQEHLAAARMQPARAQRIAELLGIFFRIAAVEESPEVSLTQKLSMVANVRDVLLDGLNQDLVDLRHQVHTHPDDALAQETLTALYPFTACVRSFTFKNKKTLQWAVENMYDLYSRLPELLRDTPEKFNPTAQHFSHKQKARKKNESTLIVAGIAAMVGMGLLGTLMLKVWSDRDSTSNGNNAALKVSETPHALSIQTKHANLTANHDSFGGWSIIIETDPGSPATTSKTNRTKLLQQLSFDFHRHMQALAEQSEK